MIRFVPSSVAELLSEKLWALSLPPGTESGEVSEMLFEPFTDTAGGHWLIVDTEFSITVHQEAELDGIADILQPWIDAGSLPPDTNATLAAFIESNRGGLIVPWNAFPQLFRDMGKTFEQMQADNLFPSRS